jgi:hypothetical protein
VASTTSTTPNDNPSTGDTAQPAQPEGAPEMATATKTAPRKATANSKAAPKTGPASKPNASKSAGSKAAPAAKSAPAKTAKATPAPAKVAAKGLAFDEAMSSTARTKEERYKDNARAVRTVLREQGYDVRAVSRAHINAFAWFPIMSDAEAKTIDKLLAAPSCPFVATNVTGTRVYIQFSDRV